MQGKRASSHAQAAAPPDYHGGLGGCMLLLREPLFAELATCAPPTRPSLNPRLGPPPSGLYTPRCTPAVHGVEEPVLLLFMHPTARDCACVSGQATRVFPDGTLLVVPRPVLMSSPSGSSGGVVLGGDV